MLLNKHWYYNCLLLYNLMATMKEQKPKPTNSIQEVLESYCQVCFVPFNRVVPKKLDEGQQICFCVRCKCRVHKCCYDMQANSSFVTNKLRQFVCERCDKKELADKACIICFKKDGALKKIANNQVIHVFCGLLHNEIVTNGYYPQITFKKSQNYKEVRNLCGICSKPNATEQCAMESCFKRYHGYCIMLNYKKKELDEQDPQCQKYYLSSGDNGNFDLSSQLMPKGWVYEQFEKVLSNFEQYGFKVDNKEILKEQIYQMYEKQEKQQKKNENILKRGGFAYILCQDHDNPMYCNCLNRGSGDMVQCQCCFEWYHQKCVSYQSTSSSENFVCSYCLNFYQLKKKIIDEVKSTKTEAYELKFQAPKLHLNDYIWLLRVIDHRIAGGGANKMIKQLAKYPLKTSKMQLVVRNQNKKKIINLTQLFTQKYLESKEHQDLLKPKVVLGLDSSQKPIIISENVQYNKRLKKYVDFIQNFVRKNNLPDSFGPIIHELKFKQRAIEDNYETILQLSKSQSGYPQIPILKMKVEEYSFMEVIKDIDSGSNIRFEDLERAVLKAKNSSSNVPSYLLKPLIQRYEKVKNLVQLVTKNINQKKESSTQTQNAVKKLKQQKISPPQAYLSFYEQKKFVNELYLLYLKQQGKALQQSIDTPNKIQILLKEPTCKPNRQIAECVNSFGDESESSFVFEHLKDIVNKYSKMCVMYELKQSLKKKSIKLSTLQTLYNKYQKLQILHPEPEIANLITNWTQIRNQWVLIKNDIESTIETIDDITVLTTAIKNLQELFKKLQNFPIQFINKIEEVPELGSISRLQQLKSWVDALAVLYTQAQLKKIPMTYSRLPQGLPRQNPLVKQYLSFKKQQNQLMSKYNAIYARAHQKIDILKSDLKKPRNQQMKQNLQKPRMTQITNFLQQLKQSKISMETQIRQLTKTVNKSIQIGSKVNKFIASQKHLQNLTKQQQIDAVKKQIDELRRKVLNEAEVSLQSQLKQLYHAEICVRMQKMIITPNNQLDKMSKLIKFAQEEGLTHLSTYRRLKSKFQVGNQSSKQITLTKKHQQYLASQAQKLRDSDTFYNSLVFARRTLPLGIPQQLKQKNKHYEQLLNRNQFLKTKIDMILSQQPKKYELAEAKTIYLQALKHPFQVEGLNKLINEFQKASKVVSLWKQQRQIDSSRVQIFLKYEDLVFFIPEISKAQKQITQFQQMLNNVRRLNKDDLNIQSLCKVQQNLQNIEQSNLVKNNKLYSKFKIQYYNFWVRLLQKFRKQQNQSVPFSKIKSILLDVYTTLQKNVKSGLNIQQLKGIVNYLQDLMVGIRNQFQANKQNTEPIYEGFIDIEQLKYQVSQGLDIKDQIKILNPFNDLHRFSNLDLIKSCSRTIVQQPQVNSLKRQRTQTELQDPFAKQSKNQKSHRQMIPNPKHQKQSDNQQWQKNQGNIVSEAQRSKAKQLILKNIKKNPLLSNYQNLSEQVKMIQNQVFGDNHNQIVKYFELVNSFEKLFIKLLTCPNLSAKLVKKKFQWKFLMLLISNMSQISDIQSMLNKQANEQPKQLEKKDSKVSKDEKQKQKQKQKEGKQKEAKKSIQEKKQKKEQKQKTIQEMIASGQIDESVRKEMKRQIRAIREKAKKKKHKGSSRRRSRSRSRSRSKSHSPQAQFSSQSQQINDKPVIQRQYNQTAVQKALNDPYNPKQSIQAPLLYDPQMEQIQQAPNKKIYPKGATLQIKQVDMQMVNKKKGKINFKGFMMTTQDHEKIISDIVDPGFNLIQLKRDKADHQIIQYLNKPSRKKYRFLVGWFEADSKQHNQAIREFAIECDQRNKIFGVQNDHIKMHIMSIRQYIKIVQMHDPPSQVTSECAAEALKYDRLVFVIQYPSQKIYQLKGIYQNFNDIKEKQNVYPVQIPDIPMNMMNMDRPTYLQSNYMMGYNPLIVAQQQKPMQANPLKPVEFQGWGGTESAITSFTSAPSYPSQSFNPLNLLSRFSPILTDQQDNNNNENNTIPNPGKQKQKIKQQKQIDLASNILNSLAEVNIAETQLPSIPPPQRSYSIEQRHVQDPYRYPPPMANHPPQMVHSNPQMGRWPHPNMMAPPMAQMGMPRMNMPYNPMSMAQKYNPQQRMAPPSAMYKNPMMPAGPYGYPQGPLPPPNQPKQGGPGPYDPYMYQRQ